MSDGSSLGVLQSIANPQEQSTPPPVGSSRDVLNAVANQTEQNPRQQTKAKSIFERIGLLPSSDATPPPLKPGEQEGPMTDMSSGLGSVLYEGAQGAGELYAEKGPKTIASGVSDIRQGSIKKGLHKVITGAGVTAMPLAPAGIAAAPMMALRTIAGGMVGGQAAEGIAKMSGGNEDTQALSGDIGNLPGGFAAGSGLARAVLQSPARALMEKNAGSLLKILEPRKAIINHLQGMLKSVLNEKPLVQRVGDGLASPGSLESATAAKTPNMEIYKHPETGAPVSATPLLDELNQFDKARQIHDHISDQIGKGEAEVRAWIEDHNQKSPGGKTASGNPQRSNLSKNQRQMAAFDKSQQQPQDLLHGTTHEAGDSALTEGLKPNAQSEMATPKTFLTNSENYAKQYPTRPGERAVVVVRGDAPGIDTSHMNITQEAEAGHIPPQFIKEVRYYDKAGKLIRIKPGLASSGAGGSF